MRTHPAHPPWLRACSGRSTLTDFSLHLLGLLSLDLGLSLGNAASISRSWLVEWGSGGVGEWLSGG